MAEESESMEEKTIRENEEILEQQLYSSVLYQDITQFKELCSELPQAFDLDFFIDCDREENCLVLLSCAKPVEFLRIIAEEGANLYVTTPTGKNALHVACEYGRLDVVKFLVENIKDDSFLLAETVNGHSVIYFTLCAEQNREEILKYLKLTAKIDINRVLSNGSTELIVAVNEKKFESVKILCEYGADPNVGVYRTYRAIHIACQQPQNANTIQLLLDHGANKDEPWRNGQFPIHLAIKHRFDENVSVFLQAGAKFEGQIKLHNRKYRNISYICLMAWKCPALVPDLLRKGANPNDIHLPTGSSVLGLVLENNGGKETIEAIIQSGANPKEKHRGESLVKCCRNLDQILVMLEHGIELKSIENDLGKSLLRMAISENDLFDEEHFERKIQVLLSQGAKFQPTPTNEDSELMLALKRRFFRIANYFIANGADVKHVGENGNTVLHLICKENHGWPIFVKETHCRNFIRGIQKAGGNFNARNKVGLTPLLCHLFSSPSPDKFIFESLISKGADMYVLHPSSKKSILAYIIENSLTELLDVVLKANYNVNRPESNGDAPVFLCLLDTTIKKEMFRKLLANGASVNVHDKNGQSLIERVLLLKQIVPYTRTQSHWLLGFMRTVHLPAPHPEMTELLTLLFSRGADVNFVGKDGNTPLFTAINEEMFKTAIDLIERGADVNYIGANNLTTLECCYAVFKKSIKESHRSFYTATEISCQHVMCAIIGAGFHLDRVLSNGLLPLDMASHVNDADSVLVVMLSSLVDAPSFSKEKDGFLHSLLDKHPITILAFLTKNQHVHVSRNKDGKSAFEVYSENVFYAPTCVCKDSSDTDKKQLVEFCLLRVKLAMRKKNPRLRIFSQPFEANILYKQHLNNDIDLSAVLPEHKLLDDKNRMEFKDEKSMIEALEINETVFKNKMERIHLLTKAFTGSVYPHIADAMEECCSAIGRLMAFENVSANRKLSWGMHPICVAVKLNSTELVKFMLMRGADPNIMDSWDETPLSLAIILQNLEMIQLLIKGKANVNHMASITSDLRQSLLSRSLKIFLHSPIQWGVPKNNILLKIVKVLVENGADVNLDVENVDSALIEAVRMQDFEIVTFLLKSKAEINHKGIQGLTALHVQLMQRPISRYRDADSILNILTAHGASVNIKSVHDDESMLNVLTAHGASVNIKSVHGETPIHVALRQQIFKVIPNLISQNLEPNITDNDGLSYLMLAAQFGEEDLVEHFVDIGADCSLVDSKGNSALHYACYENFKTCVFHILLRNGCSINLKNNEGLTPLNLYLMKNHRFDHFCLFLENGSDPSNCIENIHSPLMIVLEKGSSEMVQCILEHGVDVNHRGASNTTALHIALEKAAMDIPILKTLVEAGADVNKSNTDGESPLCCCLKSQHRDEERILNAVTFLVENGAVVNSERGTDSPLHFAVASGLRRTIEFLIEKGAKINHVGNGDITPLMKHILKNDSHRWWNMKENDISFLELLLLHNANPNAEDRDGNSVLNVALSKVTAIDYIRSLLKAGADPLHSGKDGLNAYQQAIEKGWTYIELVMEEYKSDHITNQLFCVFWKKALEWRKSMGKNLDSYHKSSSTYKIIKDVFLKILACTDTINIHITDERENTPLIFFSTLNECSIMRILIEKGADVNYVGENGWNAIHALYAGLEFEVKSEAFELLLKHDGDFSSEDEAGESVLDKAIENYLESSYLDQNSNSRQFLLSVLNSGKHIREYDDILLHAAKIGDFHVAKHIIQKGADCTVKDGAGHNVLQLWITSRKAEKSLHQCLDFIETYKNHGGPLSEMDENQNTPLMLFLGSSFLPSLFDDQMYTDRLIDMLTTKRSVVNKINLIGFTPLIKAVSVGDLNCIKKLLDKGAKINIKDRQGNSLLHLSTLGARKSSSIFEIVSFILDKGACVHVNSKNKFKETPLYLTLERVANSTDRFNCVQLLLKSGANPNVGCFEKNPLGKAVDIQDVAIANLLLQHGAKAQFDLEFGSTLPLQKLFRWRNSNDLQKYIPQFVILLNERKNNINTAIDGKPILHFLVSKSEEPDIGNNLIKTILDLGADVNAEDNTGSSVLSVLTSNNIDKRKAAIGKVLLENGANPNQGYILSQVLSNSRHSDHSKSLIINLLDHGANPDLYRGQRPNIIQAVKNTDKDVVVQLVEKGVNVNAVDGEKNTCLHWALSSGKTGDQIEIASLLISYQVILDTENKNEQTALSLEIERLANWTRTQWPSDGVAIIDLSLFNMLICGGSESLIKNPKIRDTRTSPLVELIKAGLLKTAATLVTCGYDLSHDEEFGQFDMSKNDWSKIVYQYRPYKRINYENDVLLLENVIADYKNEEIPALALACRKMIRQLLTSCSKGAEIESKIMSLPLPQKMKSFLSLRENTFEQEIIEILECTDNRQIYIYDSDDNYYVDSDDYGDVGYYYDDDSDDETIFDWFY
ncbi:uncharacterized protein [Magallana gigas]|uniref:uncharacterized protein isoform X7 n=1 Tax=Magallana gigas TaxID=29159 RepID=UPI00333E8015